MNMDDQPFRECAMRWLADIDLEGGLADKIQELRLQSVCDGVDWVRRLLRRELPKEADTIIALIDTAFESKDECLEELSHP